MSDAEYPDDLQYTVEHEWVRAQGAVARVGITAFAQEALGDIVFVSLPPVGSTVTAGEQCGEVESTKSVSDLYAPISGQVVAVNEALADRPELINSDPYQDGWMFDIEPSQPAAGWSLLTADDYRAQVG